MPVINEVNGMVLAKTKQVFKHDIVGQGFGSTYGNGTTDIVLTGLTADATQRTYFVLATPNGWGGGNLGRLFDTTPNELLYLHSTVGGLVYWRQFSGGVRTWNLNNISAVSNKFGKLTSFCASFDSSSGSNTPRLYLDGEFYVGVSADAVPSGGVVATTVQKAIGNRSTDYARNFDGTIYLFLQFDRLLSDAEVKSLNENPWQVFNDASASRFIGNGASGTSAVSADDAASYNVIGSVAQDASTSYSVLSSSSVSSDSAANYLVRSVVSCDGATMYSVRGTTQSDGATNYQILPAITIYNTADRGTADLANSSVTPNGSTPTIAVKNRWFADNSSGARNTLFHVTGVNGLRPVFDVDRSNMELTGYTGKFKWSYTGEIGTWNDFTTTTRESSPNVYRSQNSAAFTQDTVYVSMANPWRIGYTLPWIQSLESSGYVSYAPSGGSSYQFETRSATTNGSTAGTGDAIAAQPLYSFKISSGAGNAPDGNPKRKLVMMSGMHAAEDVGNYALKGAVEFLASSDPLAVSVRQWFDAYVYPVVASAGRAGGATRNDFENLYKTQDVNRSWDDVPVLETITKHKAAVLSDVGSTVHVFMDFHGSHLTTDDYSYFEGTSGDSYGAKWDAAIDTHDVTTINYSSSTEYSSSWFKANKSCPYSLTPECGFLGEWTTASKELFGAANIKAIGTLISQGEWGLPIVQSDISATYTVLNSVSQDAASSYSILATTQVSSSSSADYVVRGAASQDGAATFSVRRLVSRDGAASYSVQTTVSADGSASYQVLSANAVVSSAATSYNVIGTVAASQATSFNVRAAVAADALGSYDILSTDPVLSSALAVYIIVGTVYRDAAASYIIGDQVPYILRSPVTANRYTGPVIGVLQ